LLNSSIRVTTNIWLTLQAGLSLKQCSLGIEKREKNLRAPRGNGIVQIQRILCFPGLIVATTLLSSDEGTPFDAYSLSPAALQSA
jgi:hypothetical protein